MKRDVKEEYGGTKRSLMMMRGVGDGVQWISTAMSQGDMQFLEGRTFTKEEIFAIYAPGLSSMLAVNATEANSVSGKRTFIEYGVWPHLVRIAEKITNDLLPLYGPNLVGEFEDIRVTDKQMELSEIAAYSQTHTVDEVRARYYQDDPLGDDRGNLLVTEVGKGLTPADPETAELAKEAQRKALEDPQPDPAASQQQDAQDTEDAADANQPGDDMEDAQEDMQHGDMGQMQAEGQRQGETGRQQEVKALRRWLRNRGDKADPLKFKRVHLSEADVLDIADQMGIEPAGEADTDQPPFTMTPTDGSDTRDHWQATLTAIKAMQLQLDPGEDDAAERIITELERRGESTILRAFREQWQNLLPPNAENMELGELMAYVNSRLLTAQPTVDAIARVLYDAAAAGVNIALDQLDRIGVGFDYTLVNTRAQEWAKRYSGELIANINDTTKQAVQQAVERWYGNGEPLQALIDDLQPTFSKRRAKLIAQTETTRSAAEGSRQGFRESGVVTAMVWKTSNDEKVCPHCGALDGAIVSLDGAFYDALPAELQQRTKRRFETPPAHPGCRCRIAARVLDAGGRA
jgi:SPP1 gp7 family putative phage head morphogenesis protein